MNPKEKPDLLTKKRKRDEIIKNFTDLEEIFKSERAQNIFNSLGKFSLEEYVKYFQNLSNKEFKSMNESHKKNKDPILIDKSKIKLDYTSIIRDVPISIKDILKSNLQPKGISKKIKENMNKIIPKKDLTGFDFYFKSVSENVNNIINSRSELDINKFKQIIKIYSKLKRSIDIIQINPEDEALFNLLKKFIDKSICDFYNLCIFWLSTEYLICSENKSEDMNKFRRYDLILTKIVDILKQILKESCNSLINSEDNFAQFILNIPLYNGDFISFITDFQKNYLEKKCDKIEESLRKNRDINLLDAIPFLKSFKYIYINIVNDKNLFDKKEKDNIRKKLLENFFLLTQNKKYINAKALEFIFNDIYHISKFEQSAIKDFGINGFDEIKTKNIEEKDKIEQRFFFYFFLCKKDNENIVRLPSVYEGLNESIKEMIDPYIENRFKDLIKHNEQVYAENLINECKINSEKIVICVIKNIYGNPNYKFENILENEKLYRKIKKYYMTYFQNLTRGIIEISNKIPLKDFFTSYNFVLDKIKQFEKEEENKKLVNDILEKINSKETNKNILEDNYIPIFDKITNKILFYIIYYYQKVKGEEYRHYKEIMIKFHSKKLLELKDICIDDFNKEIQTLSNELIKNDGINLSNIFDIYDNYKNNLNIMNNISERDSEFIMEKFDKMLINFINEKIKEGTNNKLLEEYYNKLSQENKKIFKDKIMKNISEQAKGTLDLILFGDM
jgi:hypothetical protein